MLTCAIWRTCVFLYDTEWRSPARRHPDAGTRSRLTKPRPQLGVRERLLHRPHGAAVVEAEDNAKAPGGTNGFFFKLRGGATPSPTAVGHTLQPYNPKVSNATAWDDEADVEVDAEARADKVPDDPVGGILGSLATQASIRGSISVRSTSQNLKT